MAETYPYWVDVIKDPEPDNGHPLLARKGMFGLIIRAWVGDPNYVMRNCLRQDKVDMALRIIKFDPSEGIDQKLVQIDDLLYQGSRGPGFDANTLSQFGITQVLSITTVNVPPIGRVCRWWLSIDDGHLWTMEQITFVRWFCQFCLCFACTALIHCDHGSSRSTGGTIIWKMIKHGMNKVEAYESIRNINPYANCRQEILDSLPERFGLKER